MTADKDQFVWDKRRMCLQAAAMIGHDDCRSIDVFTAYEACTICMLVVLRSAPGCYRMRCVYHTTPACARVRRPYATCALPAAFLLILTLTMPRRTRRSVRKRSYAVDVDVAPWSEKDALCACG